MAEAAISSLLTLLGDVLIEKVKSLRGVEGKVSSLKKELEMMQAFLKDANQKQYKDERVRQWISQIRELALDAEDTIELFFVDVEKRNEGILKKCISFPKSVNHLERIGDEIDSILKDLEAIKGRCVTYGIINLGEAAVVDTAPVERRRRQIEQRTVGLEDDVRELLQKSILNEEKKGLSIAVVEGMGGIGKSTLARKIYNHPDVVSGPFECRAWVVVSSEFAPQETIKQLILELGGAREEIKKLEEDFITDNLHLQTKLKEMLHKQLQANAYFIVLDDIWKVDHWETLKDAFPTTTHQDKKGRLLITTRNSHMSKYGQYSHKMKVLSPEKSWELFQNNALVDGRCPEYLEGVGKQIVKKCNGLPLAISVVGGLLLGKHEVDDWKLLHSLLDDGKHEVLHSTLEDDKKINIVRSILELSYQNLSPQLKLCFMCLAFFKEDALISTKRLIHIWIGQGLIQQRGKMSAEEIARGYLDELINLNIVQVKDLTLGRRVKTCQVHDLVHDICLSKAKEEMGLEILKPEAQNTSTLIESSSRKPRHCVAHGDNLVRFSSQHNKHIHSLFLVESRRFESRYWKSFLLLKRIELGYCGLRKLPSCFRSLIGLEYLRLFEWYIKFPRWLEDLKKLEIIDVENGAASFPKGKMKLESLRYLRAKWVSGVDNIEDWKNIDILKHIVIHKSFKYNSELTGSCHIRELGVELNLLEDEISRFEPLFEKMDNLVKLEIIWRWGRLLYNIPQVGNSLTKLVLDGTLRRCPSVNVFPPKLSHLTLKNSELEEDPMIELGKLPNLVFLKLSWAYNNGKRMKVMHDGFPRLEALSLDSLLILEGVDIEEGGMPSLTHLRIHNCRYLNIENLLAKQRTISHIM